MIASDDPLERAEMGRMIRLLAHQHLGPETGGKNILLEPPQQADATGDLYLGKVCYKGNESTRLSLRLNELPRHVGLFGTTGSGKSNVAYHLCQQLTQRRIPFLVIDWKRNYRNLRSNPVTSKLKVFTLGREVSPFSWNPLRPPPRTDFRAWVSIVSDVLEKSHISGAGVADVLIELIQRVVAKRPPKGAEWPTFEDVWNELQAVSYTGRKALWQASATRILRTFTYGPSSPAFNARTPVQLESLLDQPVVLELDQELPKSLRIFTSELILRWIHLYRLGQGESTKLRHVLFLEESHNLFVKSDADLRASSGLENIYREIRSFGQALLSITQHPSLLPVSLLGNTHTLMFLSLTHEADIHAARAALFFKKADEAVLDWLAIGEGVVRIKGRVWPCHVRFPYIPVQLGSVTDQELERR